MTGQTGGPTETDTMSIGGMTAGYDFTIFDDIYMDWGLSAGGGGGKSYDETTVIDEVVCS